MVTLASPAAAVPAVSAAAGAGSSAFGWRRPGRSPPGPRPRGQLRPSSPPPSPPTGNAKSWLDPPGSLPTSGRRAASLIAAARGLCDGEVTRYQFIPAGHDPVYLTYGIGRDDSRRRVMMGMTAARKQVADQPDAPVLMLRYS